MKSLFKKAITGILTWEAKSVLKKYKPTIIAITGSVGKTSTKDAVFAMIQSQTFVRKTDKNLNSELGIPLTILGLQNAWNNPAKWLGNILDGAKLVFATGAHARARANYPKCLVLEVGADHPGDIKKVAKWLQPDIVVITAVSKVPVHVEFFKSPEEVLQEKLALVRGVKITGKMILPANDPDVLAVRNDKLTVPCITFGVDGTGNVTAIGAEAIYAEGKPIGMTFRLQYINNTNGTTNVSLPIVLHDVIGIQHIYTITAAAATAIAYGAPFDTIIESIGTYKPPRGRMNILQGVNGSILIDDTYNSSPDATREALLVLRSTSAPLGAMTPIGNTSRRVAILSDMMELGKFSAEQHKKAGELVAQSADMLITVGIRAKNIAESARAHGMREDMMQSFDTSDEAAEYVQVGGVIMPRDIILIKGSQSGRMERVVKALLADPSRAAELIVRQEPEWLARK